MKFGYLLIYETHPLSSPFNFRFRGITSLGAFANCCPHKVSLRILEQDQTPSILHFHCLVFYAPDVLELRFHTLQIFSI